jgi:DNA-binding transcriptional MerR regulator
MNIGDVSNRTGLPAKTIRYYEDINLIKPMRDDNGYRRFREQDVHKLSFFGTCPCIGVHNRRLSHLAGPL